ncbi:MAG: hypothetical protein IH571_01235, partial [Acholeplasmataceae bacterium]|nr:hypothetical protein [Acholeplasmataceae bacterium]
MCGRFSISITKKEIRTFLNDAYDIEEFDDDIMLPRYNVAPGQDVISVINDGKRNRAGLM